jgi:sortase A
MITARRVRYSRTRLVGVVATLLGTLLTSGIGAGWWWTDRQARHTAHRLADGAARAWEGPRPAGGVEVQRAPDGVGGRVLAVVRIPRFGADWREPVQRGTGGAVLRQGLGLYDGSPEPGGRGNVAIAGHRTTWGAPLKQLDRLRAGDRIVIWTAHRRFDYRVTVKGVTAPSDISVISGERSRDEGSEASARMLTLTTCHPEFSARQRLYVHAVLVDSVKTV